MAVMEKDHFKNRLVAISLSLLLGTALMLLKFYVYWLTQSSAILSDALESIINVVASAFALGSVVLSAKPPDSTHPYGHEKIEYFSAGFEGALIVFAAFGIFWTAWPQILQPHELPNLGSGLLILLGTSAVNLALGLGLIRVGSRTSSLVLVADGKHILTDVFTSAGVLAGPHSGPADGMVLAGWRDCLPGGCQYPCYRYQTGAAGLCGAHARV